MGSDTVFHAPIVCVMQLMLNTNPIYESKYKILLLVNKLQNIITVRDSAEFKNKLMRDMVYF
jgi:hypothetical protein